MVELVAERFRVMAEPMRIKLLDRLRESPATVGELTLATGASQPNVSKHLGVLHAAGIVSREKDGNFVRYAIADESVFALCETGLRRPAAATRRAQRRLASAAGGVSTIGLDLLRGPRRPAA